MSVVYRVSRDGRTAAVPYTTQEHLRRLLDHWGFTRIVYYTHNTLHAVIHCGEVAPVCDIAVIVHRGEVSSERLCVLIPWMDRDGFAASYRPLRCDAVPPQPNSGSSRSGRDISAWCDNMLDPLTRFHVITGIDCKPK